MYWSDLKETEKAPERGQILAYTRLERPIFHAYESLGQIEEEIAGKELIEIHLFDREREYRAVAARRRIIETLADFPENDRERVYAETVLLEDGGTITVLNHIRYDVEISGDEDATGMAVIDNYRLRM
ncbi:MAG: hypothetical protein Q4F41_04780 [Eubacteriales bacterium]|nr:hypothetical protein [Eubacteriales bacterium]